MKVDFEIYLKVAQAMDNGNVLYRTAVDTKNMGFFFVFYGFYKLYSIFNPTLMYIYVWVYYFLFFIYFISSVMIYHIVTNFTLKPTWGLGAGIFGLLYISILEHAYILNQPQIASLWILALMWYYSTKNELLTNKEYFVSGVLLGGAFAFSTPYFIMVLVVPIVSYLQNQNLKTWFFNCICAFGGFVIALLPFIVYFVMNNAIADWWYWNFEFLSVYDETGTQFGIPFLKNIIGMFFTLSHLANTFVIFVVTSFAVCVWGYFFKINKQKLTNSQILIIIVSLFTFFARLLLKRHHSSYNIYFIPFLIIAPMCFLSIIIENKRINKKYIIAIVALVVWVLKFPASFDYSLGQATYDIKTASIINNNLDKTPTFVSSTRGTTCSFSTRWKSLGYSVYNSSDRYILNNEVEVLLLDEFGKEDYLTSLKTLNTYEQAFIKKYPLDENIVEFINDNYTKVSDIMYINNQNIKDWILDDKHLDQAIYTSDIIRKRLKLSDFIKDFIKSILK